MSVKQAQTKERVQKSAEIKYQLLNVRNQDGYLDQDQISELEKNIQRSKGTLAPKKKNDNLYDLNCVVCLDIPEIQSEEVRVYSCEQGSILSNVLARLSR